MYEGKVSTNVAATPLRSPLSMSRLQNLGDIKAIDEVYVLTSSEDIKKTLMSSSGRYKTEKVK